MELGVGDLEVPTGGVVCVGDWASPVVEDDYFEGVSWEQMVGGLGVAVADVGGEGFTAGIANDVEHQFGVVV